MAGKLFIIGINYHWKTNRLKFKDIKYEYHKIF